MSELLDYKCKFPKGDGVWLRNLTRLKKSKRKGIRVVVNIIEMVDFGNFIDSMNLVDIPLFCGKFTWINQVGSAMRRIDQFLISEDLLDLWKIVCQELGIKDLSNHYSILIRGNVVN